MKKLKSIITCFIIITILNSGCKVLSVTDGPIEIVPGTIKDVKTENIVYKKKNPTRNDPNMILGVSKRKKFKAQTRKRRTKVLRNARGFWNFTFTVSAINIGIMCLYYGLCEHEEDDSNNFNNNNNNNEEAFGPLYGSYGADLAIGLGSLGLALIAEGELDREVTTEFTYIPTGIQSFESDEPLQKKEVTLEVNNKTNNFKSNEEGEIKLNLLTDLNLNYLGSEKPLALKISNTEEGIDSQITLSPSNWLAHHAKFNYPNLTTKFSPYSNEAMMLNNKGGEEILITDSVNNYSQIIYNQSKVWLKNDQFTSVFKVDKSYSGDNSEVKILNKPALIATEINMIESNNNGFVEKEETVKITFKLENKGKATSFNTKLNIQDLNEIKGIAFPSEVKLGDIGVNEFKIVSFELKGKNTLEQGEVNLLIKLQDINKLNNETLSFIVNTRHHENAYLTLSDYQFIESKVGTIGKRVKFVFDVKNEFKEDLKDVWININLKHWEVLLNKKIFSFNNLKAGEVKTMEVDFIVKNEFTINNFDFEIELTETRGVYGSSYPISYKLK